MRLFLALGLPESMERAVVALQRRLIPALRGWRWTRPEGLHLTVRFLGEVTAVRDGETRRGWREAAAGGVPFRCVLGLVGRFPEHGAARVLWVGLDEVEPAEALSGLVDRLERTARDLGFLAESRPFHPHITLGRAVRGARPTGPGALDPVESIEGRVEELLLFESRLGPGGSRYTALEAFPLGNAGPRR